MSRKRNHRMCRNREPDPTQALAIFKKCSDPIEGDVTKVMINLRACYQRLRDGVGDVEDVNAIGLMLNVGWVRAQAVGEALVKAFMDGGEAMKECEGMLERHGRYGFTGPGLLRMNAAIDLYQSLLTLSTPRQMDVAKREAFRLLAKHARDHA